MENQNNTPPLKATTVPETSHGGEEHISLSPPPAGSPENSSSDNSGEHISLSPPPENSPARSSLSSILISSPENEKPHSPENTPPPAAAVANRDVINEPMAIVRVAELEEPKPVVEMKTDPDEVAASGGGRVAEGGGTGRRRFTPAASSILRRGKRDETVKKAALGFRIFGFLFCLISFSVLAADRNQGWALDSFERYKEFRYCMSVTIIGFVYTGAQAFDLSYNLATGRYIMRQQQKLRHYFDFAIDQMIAYLLISASSSAAIRIDDWQLNWGKDKFPDMATASVSMSFLAFVALAFSSLISGYALCTSKLY